ncbi:MAG TPA: thr operon leader peptide [Nitrosopumilus sp.]|nr:thr operon leader peptide [Thermoproteota archaeon]HJJ23572.1 thr operon leader peptide [Nitrosopumilus sp.]
MNKHSAITIIAVIIIVISIAYSGLSIIGAQQLEYRWDNPGEFNFFTMLNQGEMEFCNTVPFWINIQKFEISTFYQSKHLGSFTVQPLTINPYSSVVQEGIFSSEGMSESQHIFMTFDFMFNGGNIRLDPNQFIIVINTNTPILGVIPYSTTTQISGFEFDKIMNTENLSCD